MISFLVELLELSFYAIISLYIYKSTFKKDVSFQKENLDEASDIYNAY
jgi:hypothetical protein